MNERAREMVPLAAWMAALVVALVAFTAMGTGPLAAPALTEPGSWSEWAHGRDAVVATAALLRLVVLALAWYLLGVTAVGAVARLARLTAMVRVADSLSLPVVRHMLQASLGVGLVTAVAVSSTPLAGSRAGADPVLAAADHEVVQADTLAPPRMRPLPSQQVPAPTTPHPDDTPPIVDLTPSDLRPGVDSHDSDDPVPPDGQATPPPAGEAADATTVTVRPGDHLWSIAERHLAARHGHVPAEREVIQYWRRLIEANRDLLVDPANPDLILPGQQFGLPDDADEQAHP